MGKTKPVVCHSPISLEEEKEEKTIALGIYKGMSELIWESDSYGNIWEDANSRLFHLFSELKLLISHVSLMLHYVRTRTGNEPPPPATCRWFCAFLTDHNGDWIASLLVSLGHFKRSRAWKLYTLRVLPAPCVNLHNLKEKMKYNYPFDH